MPDPTGTQVTTGLILLSLIIVMYFGKKKLVYDGNAVNNIFRFRLKWP
jgi:hypothetical protein